MFTPPLKLVPAVAWLMRNYINGIDFYFLVFQRCFWSKMTKKKNHDFDNFWSKIDIFWLFNNFLTVHVGSFLTKMDNLRRRKCSKFWFDESKCRHIMKHDMLWMRWLNLLCFGLYIQTGFIMIRIALVSNTYK